MSMSLRGGRRPGGMSYRRLGGFTLIEVMTALVILGILLTVGVPAVNQMMAGQRVKSVAADLHTSLVLARGEAVVRNRQVTVAPAADSTWEEGWRVTEEDSDAGPLLQHSLESGVEITSEPAEIAQIVFRPNGRASAAGTLKIESVMDSRQTRCVEIGLDGRARSRACND